ncbi:SDR family oxidoreductase [Synergistaceae bacterium OttesenSCG-928-D05]|nr:SDR family oxidoreductase [Synergistaceae bacterium OttesenSCG-928-D05]
MRFKLLVLGASGMAGHTIALYMKEQGHDVLGFDNRPVNHCESITGDAKNSEELKNLISNEKFDAVINCIGILNQFAEQKKELAVLLNAYLPHVLADVTSGTRTKVIHMSTDCVFSGTRGEYTEADFPDGKTFYDRSKALGELDDEKNITLRTSIVGPDLNPNGIGLLNWFMCLPMDSKISGYQKVLWTGVTTLQLAKAMEAALQEDVHGLYNMVYKDPISKYDLLLLFNKYMRGSRLLIAPFDGIVSNKSLKRTRFDFGYLIPDYEKMISDLATWMKKYERFYPHYNFFG